MVLRNLKVELGWGFGLAAATLALRLRLNIDSRAAVIMTTLALSALYWTGSLLIDVRLRQEVLQLLGARLIPARRWRRWLARQRSAGNTDTCAGALGRNEGWAARDQIDAVGPVEGPRTEEIQL
jgi:hypothetical protein